MTNRVCGLVAAAMVVGLLSPAVYACWDNSDLFVTKLKKVNLTTEQLKDIFRIREQHKAVVVRAHKEGLGCTYHENHDKVFEKQAVGILNDKQFQKAVGRKRTRVESLTYENKVLKRKLAEMGKRLARLEAALKAAAKTGKKK